MISIRSESGELIKIVNASEDSAVVYHKQFGFCAEDKIENRQTMREASGLYVQDSANAIAFAFQPENSPTQKNIIAKNGCQIEKIDENVWKLFSNSQTFELSFLETKTASAPIYKKIEAEKDNRLMEKVGIALFLFALLFMVFNMNREIPVAEVKPEEPLAPVVVKAIEVPKVAPIQKPAEVIPAEAKNQAIDKTVKAQKALTQNLGFLKMLGRKDLTKAVGGLPTPNLKEASPGAGPGGKEGSGGEMLAGLGQGLRKTTVGNSGVAGLGGVGTKGAGGGLGGYGETDYASGGGRAISTVPLSKDAVVEGGLDKSLIQATIMRYLSQVRACYEEGLKRQADMIGQVTMDFNINGAGAVTFAKVQRSSLGDKQVEGCISTRMLNWKFPLPRGGVDVKVSYPFMLRPVKS